MCFILYVLYLKLCTNCVYSIWIKLFKQWFTSQIFLQRNIHTQTHIISCIVFSLAPQIQVRDLWLIVCTWSTVGTSIQTPLNFSLLHCNHLLESFKFICPLSLLKNNSTASCCRERTTGYIWRKDEHGEVQRYPGKKTLSSAQDLRLCWSFPFNKTMTLKTA